MPKPSDIEGELKTIFGLFDLILPWITKTELRITLVKQTLFLIPFIAIGMFILSLFGVAQEHKNIQKLDLAHIELRNEVALTIDYLNICQKASSESLRRLYCEMGEIYYKKNIKKLKHEDNVDLSEFKERIINLNGYEAMIVNMNNLLRINEIHNIKAKSKPHWFEQLVMLINPKYAGVIILSFFLIIFALSIIPYFVMTNSINKYLEAESKKL